MCLGICPVENIRTEVEDFGWLDRAVVGEVVVDRITTTITRTNAAISARVSDWSEGVSKDRAIDDKLVTTSTGREAAAGSVQAITGVNIAVSDEPSIDLGDAIANDDAAVSNDEDLWEAVDIVVVVGVAITKNKIIATATSTSASTDVGINSEGTVNMDDEGVAGVVSGGLLAF